MTIYDDEEYLEFLKKKPIPPPELTIDEIHQLQGKRRKTESIWLENTQDTDKFEYPNLNKNDVVNAKQKLSKFTQSQIHQARGADRKFMFVSRAALKLADLDSETNFSKILQQKPYFVDLCAGPGGFSQYLMFETDNQARGVAMTLKTEDHLGMQYQNDNLELCYGEDETGDILLPKNREYLASQLKNPVSLVVADGGMEIQDYLNHEKIMLPLIQAQVNTMELILKEGNFVLKIFDIFDKETVNVIWKLHCMFEKIAILKPPSSRPANSEKYIVCIKRINSNLGSRNFKSYVEDRVSRMISLQIQALERLVNKIY